MRLLLLSDFACQNFPQSGFAKFCTAQRMDFDGVLIVGILNPAQTYQQTHLVEAFREMASEINLLLLSIGLTSRHLVILPNLTDLSWGSALFSKHFHYPMTGDTFDPYGFRFLKLNELKLLAVNTVQATDQFGFRESVFLEGMNAAGNEPTGIFMQHPPNQWHINPTEAIHQRYLNGHFHFIACRGRINPFPYKDILTLGEAPPLGLIISLNDHCLTSIRLKMSQQRCSLGEGRAYTLPIFSSKASNKERQ